MLKRNILFGLLMSWLSSFAQRADSIVARRKLTKTDISAVYAHYIQDGDHSAVTGGAGTEKLQVYAPEISIVHQRDSSQTISLRAGVDVITSASTDKIDFVRSSASYSDVRGHAMAGYERKIGRNGWAAGASGAFSVESDYLSLGGSLSARFAEPVKNVEYSIRFEAFFDDLRWALFRSDEKARLLYPQELRNTNWFDIYTRNSCNLSLSISRVLNRRMIFSIFPELHYQHGLLSTPFHRVYFTDNSKRVENLPKHRLRIPVGMQLNSFIADRYILRSYYRIYWDDFGIAAHTIDLEMPVKLDPVWTAAPFFRFYTQTQSRYFKPYGKHHPETQYYTSDYDLSAFQSYQAGLGLRFAPFRKMGKRWEFKAVEMRYAWYGRSDGLKAHIITFLFDVSRENQRLLP